MEDLARLAYVEHSIKDFDMYYQVLIELFSYMDEILENPQEGEFRIITSHGLRLCFSCKAFTDYLKYVGLQLTQNEYMYPGSQTLSGLRISQAAVERKIRLCSEPLKVKQIPTMIVSKPVRKRKQLIPSFIQINLHPMLVDIRTKFNNMLKYEDINLLQRARERIPLVSLQSMAMERITENFRKIKAGETKDPKLTFDIALIMELIVWFKHTYFSWVDKPSCEKCDGPTEFVCTSKMTGPDETCMVEVYKCKLCSQITRFPRYNNPATVMLMRRGRCGEWANCFTLFCRALAYDTRLVFDDKDHVWCEVFAYDGFTWLHVDPCEGSLNTPLMYSHGWKKTLSYVFAFSRDDLQDVTWRYTMDHKEVRKRRTAVSEQVLLDTIMALRTHRHAQLTPARRNYLADRNIRELAELMKDRKPSEEESSGRISGSLEWRRRRREAGTVHSGRTFYFNDVGVHVVRYHTSLDSYKIYTNGFEVEQVSSWKKGVHECKNMFRKEEMDWHQVYLAREEGEPTGSISWAFAVKSRDLIYSSISITLVSKIFENGCIEWTIQFDDEPSMPFKFDENVTIFERVFTRCVLRAWLSGGRGRDAWQHAQLFRTARASPAPTMEVTLRLGKETYD